MKIRVSENHKAAYNLRLPRSLENYFYTLIEKARGEITAQRIKTSADVAKMETKCIFKQFIAALVPLETELYAKGKFE